MHQFFKNIEIVIFYLIFKDYKIIHKKIDFKNINYDELVQSASTNLLLPQLYVSLNKKKLLTQIPEELSKYLSEIYRLNLERNKQLILELSCLSDLLNSLSINHAFLKGSALVSYLNFDLGSRMIGDIDILVSDQDFDKCINALTDIGYMPITDYDFFDVRHYPRLVNKEKIFAVEIHSRLLRKKFQELSSVKILKNKILSERNYYILNLKNNILHTILNDQINDFGYLYCKLSYRSLIDLWFLGFQKEDLSDFDHQKYIRNHHIFLNYLLLDSTNNDFLKPISKNLFLLRLRLKKSFNFYKVLDMSYARGIYSVKVLLDQVFTFIINPKYRIYIINKYL